MKKLLLLAAFVLACGLISAQTVKGTVTDSESGEGLEGAAVVVQGTTIGALTDGDGNFTLRLPDGATTLIINFVGYKTIEESINGRSTINVALTEDVYGVEEVVVTAIGLEANKKSVGYSVQNVDAGEIIDSRETNLVNALNSKVAGVTVVSSSGSPGASSNIRIRGNVSVTGNNSPLFVIDGVPIDNSASGNTVDGVDNSNRAIDINPNDVESLTVLKGPAATALYGIRAANGAIIITTKTGVKGKPKFTISAGYTADEVNKLPERQTTFAQGRPVGGAPLYRGPETFEGFSWGPAISDLEFDGSDYPFDRNGRLVAAGDGNGTPANVYDPYSFFVTGQTVDLNASVQGGSDNISYYVSAGRLASEGVVPNSSFARTSFRTRIQAQLSKKLSVGMAANYVNSGGNRLQRGSNLRGVMLGLLRNTPTFDIGDGKVGQEAADDNSVYELASGDQRSYRSGIYDNPYWVVNKNATQDDVNRMIGYASARYEFTDWLSASFKAGVDQFTDERNGAIDINPGWFPGQITNTTQTSRDVNTDLLLQINKNISEDLTFNATLGHNYFATRVTTKQVIGNTLASPDFYHISNAADLQSTETVSQRELVGVLGTFNFGYKEYLFLNLSARQDWTSTLPEGQNGFFAPAASLGFVFTEAFGMQDNKVLPYGKIRASWGRVGNDPGIYGTLTYFNSAVNSGDGFIPVTPYPSFGTNAFERSTLLGNPDLRAELTTTIEFGAELKFLNNRVGLDLTYYNSSSDEQILPIDLSAASGFTSFIVNAGTVTNEGIEAVLNLTPVKSKNFVWDIDVNFTRYKNIVESLSEASENVFLAGFTSTSSRAIAGEPYGAIYGSGFQKDDNGNTIIGDNGWPLQDAAIGFQGDPNPDWIAGLRNTFTFKGFRLSALIDIRQGGDMWCGTCGVMSYFGTTQQAADDRSQTEFIFDGVNADGAPNDVPVSLADPATGLGSYYRVRYGFGGIAEMYVYETSWVRLRELTLNYTVPSSALEGLPFSGASITLSGRNLWLNTHKAPLLVLSLFGVIIFSACGTRGPSPQASGFPDEVASILVNSCATTGCHTAQSAPAAAGLNLETWEDMFKGSRGGSPVIPFAPSLSYFLYSVNTDPSLGIILAPTMPYNDSPLSPDEYAALWNWIHDGAPNAEGELRFPPSNTREKWYVGHQLCDEVAIFDAESRQLMRYIDVGSDPISSEFVFDIQISPSGEDWFVVFFGTQDYISRYSTRTDEKITDINVGWLAWSTLALTKDGKFGFLCSEHLSHLQAIDLERNMKIGDLKEFAFEVRGATIHPNKQEIYLAEFKDRGLTVVSYDELGAFTDDRHIDLVQNEAPTIPGDLYPFEITFLPDGSKYFVSCNNSQEVRVLDGQTDSLLEVIELPAIPSKMTYSASTNRLFVSCMEDLVSWPNNPERRGSIVVIDSRTNQVTQSIYSGFQPYSLAADDDLGVLIVTNRNTDPSGPVPHHASTCEGRNGYVTLIDLESFELISDYKPEILADPSTIAIK